MTRSPLRGPRRSSHDDSRSSNLAREQAQEVVSLADTIQKRLIIPQGLPTSEEERRATYQALARLRAQRKTRAECGQALNISERSVARYLADPLYQEVQNGLIAESKQRGYLLISEMTDDALAVLYGLMHNGKSEFVRYKAAEKLLEVAEYNTPREEQRRDSREEVQSFLEEVRRRQSSSPQVTVNINSAAHTAAEHDNQEETRTIEAAPALPIPPYSSPVQPGGKLPDDFLQAIGHQPVDDDRKMERFRARLRQEDDGLDPYS